MLLAVFFVIESRVRAPLVPLGLLRRRNLATANVVGVLWAAAMFAWFFLSALYLQLVLGYSPLQVGLSFLPANLIMGLFSLGLSAKIVMRYGIKPPLATGLLLAAAGLLLFARAPVDGNFVVDVLPEHDPARLRRGPGVQSCAARSDERCRAERERARVGNRQHRVHDGRRARSRRAGEHRAHRTGNLEAAGEDSLAALTGGYHVAFVVGAFCAIGAASIGVAFLRSIPMMGHEAVPEAEPASQTQ